MHEIILCKLGEVVLKGLNRRSFEMKLMSNIRRRTQRFGKWKIYSRQSTIYVEPVEDACDIAGAYAACKQVFGVIAVSRALPCEKDVQAIIRTAKANDIDYTLEIMEGDTGTNAWTMQIVGRGIACALLSIPQKHLPT